MDTELQTPRIRKLATTGAGHFGEAGEEGAQNPLFPVVACHSMDHAVEQATVLMCAVHKISDLAMVETDHLPTLLTAVHYLRGILENRLTADERFSRSFGLPAERCMAGIPIEEAFSSFTQRTVIVSPPTSRKR